MTCFKAYDIRGRVPEDLDENLSYRIGYAYARLFNPGTVILGYDIRLESPSLSKAVSEGLRRGGANVINIGLCGTEEVYFQTFSREAQGIGGGIMVTASHNPKGYNGMKLVGKGSCPISEDSGLHSIRDLALSLPSSFPQEKDQQPIGNEETVDIDKSQYISHLLSYTNPLKLKPLKIVVNPGNGSAGDIIRLLEPHLPFQFIYIQDTPDGNFPHGVPNPLLPENRKETSDAIKLHNADMGIAWDGDFDRCFLFDEKGNFIEGYYIVGLLAEFFLKKHPGEKVIHDPRLTWNTIDIVKREKGIPLQNRTGHAFIKERMRKENALYGGEMSAHHYFRDFAYCDSGMIPWLLVCETINATEKPLSFLVQTRMEAYPCSGEINYKVHNPQETILKISNHFSSLNPHVDTTDGLSLEFSEWRLNVRSSNTEPLLRLNIETRNNPLLLKEKTRELEQMIKASF
jgi:phosphomannomutase/phosphoglucomutase